MIKRGGGVLDVEEEGVYSVQKDIHVLALGLLIIYSVHLQLVVASLMLRCALCPPVQKKWGWHVLLSVPCLLKIVISESHMKTIVYQQ